jgi:hypothetical protein
MIKFADGQEFAEADVRGALGFKAEHELRKASLPASPDGYELKLPDDFKGPEGIQWEWNAQNPMLQRARQEAHRLGLDQAAFSSLLGLYCADRMNAEMQLSWARQAELQKLGPAGESRVAQVEQWLRARVGSDADVIAAQLRSFPHAGMLRAFEKIVSQFVNQGAVPFDQRGRVNEDNRGKIPNYDSLDFKGRRVAQMKANMAGRGPRERD